MTSKNKKKKHVANIYYYYFFLMTVINRYTLDPHASESSCDPLSQSEDVKKKNNKKQMIHTSKNKFCFNQDFYIIYISFPTKQTY